MLSRITPIVLTYNEEQNIARCLEQLTWAKQVLVIDSFSDDRTVQIARGFANVTILQHRFAGFTEQWTWALSQEVPTEWVLALDADYVLTRQLVEEMGKLAPDDAVDGYRVSFDWAVHGRLIRSNLYPALIVLFRKTKIIISRYGHAQKAIVEKEDRLKGRIVHDDRKPISRWLSSQIEYATDEADLLRSVKRIARPPEGSPADPRQQSMSRNDRLRRIPLLTTIMVPIYLLFVRGLILDGKSGLHYVLQRTLSEATISLALLDAKLRRRQPSGQDR